MSKNFKTLFISIILVSYFIVSSFFHISIPCIFHLITGFYCPGCGITRMIIALSNGKFYQAFRYNSFLFLLTPLFLIFIINYLYSLIKNKKPLYQKIPNKYWYILIFFLLLFGIIRNIFHYFAPTLI